MKPVTRRSDAVLAWGLSGLFAVGIFGLSYFRGSSSIPRNDDWSYRNVVLDWVEGGHLVLNGWVHMMFVVQGFLGGVAVRVLGYGLPALQLLVLALGTAGLVAIYLISRSLLSKYYAALVVLLTGLSPLWINLSLTFMTDIPAWAFSAISFALGVTAIIKQRSMTLVVGAGVALLGFGVREYSIVPFLALLVWVTWSAYPKRLRLWALVIGVVTLGLCSVTYVWRQSLPGSIETTASAPLQSLALFSRLLVTLALLLSPFASLCAVFLWPRRGMLLKAVRTYWFGASLGIIVAIGFCIVASLQLAGNVIHPFGSSWTSVGDGVRSLPRWGFTAVTLLGVVSLVALLAVAGMFVQRRIFARSWKVLERSQESNCLAGLYVFAAVAVMIVYFVAIIVAGAPAFDRYLLLVVPLLGIVILWLATRSLKEPISKWQKSAVAGILVVTGAFGVVIADGLNQVDGLRWQVASELVESGIPAYKIDGGDAWFRYHQKDAPGVAQVGSLENSIPGRTWWQTFFEGSTFCRMVAIESETDLQAMYGPALSIQEERTLLGTPFRVMVFPGPDPC
jgi:4-amino-4-deoxy-L-arabinose transferase-like glycosyltransferase